MNLLAEFDEAMDTLQRKPRDPVRVKTPVAKKMLLDNAYVTVGDKKRFLRIKALGLGVHEVAVADLGGKPLTLIVK